MNGGFVYVSGERRPVEVLVFRVEPGHVDEFLRVDHEVWTLGEALLEGHERIPFLSKGAAARSRGFHRHLSAAPVHE